MKAIYKAIIIGFFGMALTTLAFAEDTTTMSKKWKCETNASSSSNAEDKTADENMKNNAKDGKSAFDYAMQHCRDCTKITCSAE